MEAKQVKIKRKEITLLRYNNTWVFPVVTTYQHGLGSPVALKLYSYQKKEFNYYCSVTINLPDCPRNAGCQFIDTNNNGQEILEWLEEHNFGKRTDREGKSGFCTYPLFDFYKGEKYWEYRRLNEKLGSFL